jgi:hypothetical protein
MRRSYFVKDSEADTARQLEKRVLDLPLVSGILFVGISVQPEQLDKPPVYCFWIGCHRDFDEQTAVELIRYTFREEIARGLNIRIEAHRGVGRPFLEKC